MSIKEWLKTSFTCQNPSCKKSFKTPLKALNLQQQSCEPYTACPYCLTEITDAFAGQNNKSEKTVIEKTLHKEKTAQNGEKPADCCYHFGYLSERQKGEQIPDECLTCVDILECMLRKTR